MKTPNSNMLNISYRKALRFLTLVTAVVMSSTAVSMAAGVDVAQSPLVVQKPLPPNIILMLDDSGSMGWDYMPDSSYLANRHDQGYHSSDVNGVYYNPDATTVYAIPKQADGTSYSTPGFNSAWLNGFDQSGYENLNYYSRVNNNYYSSESACINGSDEYTCAPVGGGYYRRYYPFYYYTYNATQSGCSLSQDSCYTKHYVRDACPSTLANCSDDAATKQRVAIWYSYYRTRILMAKSGLMNAFSNLDSKYRVGFGSINNHGSSWMQNNSVSSGVYNNVRIAHVEEWSGQKADFWGWLQNLTVGSSTPLRRALKAAGDYYETDQPWQTSDSDSSKLSCRQSYTILTTDGFWNGSSPSDVGDADNTSGATASTDYTDANGVNGYAKPGCTPASNSDCHYVYNAQAPYSLDNGNLGDSSKPTLADVAMYYWKNDLQTGLDNDVPTTPNDPAFWQHMTTFTLGLGFDPVGITPSTATVSDIFSWARTLDSGGTPNVPSNFSWPTNGGTLNNTQYTISDLAHAAVNGHGAFFSAKDPNAFEKGIADALGAAGDRQGNGNGVAFNGDTLSAGSLQFKASYFTGQWTGTLVAIAADNNLQYGGGNTVWNAETQLQSLGYAGRNIWTTKEVAGNGNQGSTTTPVAFQAANLSQAEKDALTQNIGSGITVPNATTIVNYLRGDNTYNTNNGGTLRARAALLGDIVHSSPVYVGPPAAGAFSGRTFDGSSSYSTFASNNDSRQPVVYVASNDGMLHAFAVNDFTYTNASNQQVSVSAGQELFAFIPGAVLRQTGDAALSRLANPSYGKTTSTIPHQYFNDGKIAVQNVYINSAWHTVLVGTTGRGPAKAVYALDITDPNNISVMWERSAGDGKGNDSYIGQMLGVPVISEVTAGNNKSEWVALIGNGPNSTSSTPGQAALLQFDIATGDLQVYTATSGASGTAENGLAGPAVWQANGTNNISTDAYAGDLQGNVWHFTLSSSGGTGVRIYQAEDGSNNPQPITAQMLAMANPSDSSRWIFFGTGRYLDQSDISATENAKVQTWYGLRVHSGNSNIPVVSTSSGMGSSRSTSLAQRSIVAEATVSGQVLRATSPVTANDMVGKVGWFMDLTDPANTGDSRGERIIQPSQDIAGYVYVSTLIPSSVDACHPYPQGAVMAVDPFTGANPGSIFGDGSAYTTINGETVYYNGFLLNTALGGELNAQKTAGGKIHVSGVGLDSTPFNAVAQPNTGNTGRLSWREIVNK